MRSQPHQLRHRNVDLTDIRKHRFKVGAIEQVDKGRINDQQVVSLMRSEGVKIEMTTKCTQYDVPGGYVGCCR